MSRANLRWRFKQLLRKPYHFWKVRTLTSPSLHYPPAALDFTEFDTWEAFQKSQADLARSFQERTALEDAMATDTSKPVEYAGQCGVCCRDTTFHCDWSISYDLPDGGKRPVWRERLVCDCGISNRLRGSLHFMLDRCGLNADSSVYLTEQTTPFFNLLKSEFESVVGSEYLADGTKPGQTNANGLRHEDITALTFEDDQFDILGCFEVLEHVPDYKAALAEMFRVLKPGGHLVATFPFRLDLEDTLMRARIDEQGEIEHILEPEYHGDPLSDQGVLCFYHFGWDILDALRSAGFSKATCGFFWSKDMGYLGAGSSLFHAVK